MHVQHTCRVRVVIERVKLWRCNLRNVLHGVFHCRAIKSVLKSLSFNFWAVSLKAAFRNTGVR